MKIKHKGKKVHPSPSPPQPAATSPSSAAQDSLSNLNLLPAAILALITTLSLQDREVLAYMITRSLKTTTTTTIGSANYTSSLPSHEKQQKSADFDCECFDCYTSFWFRWDSSPNREVIHQAIEAFEEHLASGEVETKRSSNRRGKKKEKQLPVPIIEKEVENETLQPPEIIHSEVNPIAAEEEAAMAVVVRAAEGGHKGFARKVLPDVLGMFNSRLWNLWGPNV